MSAKAVLFIMSQPPYAGALANEALDLLLVAAAFDLKPSVLFTGDGVYQLVASDPQTLAPIRNVGRALEALPSYDVDQIFADRDSLRQRGIDDESLLLRPRVLDRTSVQALISRQAVVFSG